MPDSALRVLLKNAYKNITKNYPQKATYLTGFYREVNESIDSSRFNYFSESVFKTYKPPYTLAGAEYQGQVQVLKTRKIVHPTYEKNGVRFHGGPYLSIRGDRVLKRESIINPKSYRRYNYELEKITSYEGKPVYVVAFADKDSVFNGKIYIDKTDLAYLKIETFKQLDKKELKFIRLDYTETIIFDKKDDFWYLKYYKGVGNFKATKERFSLTAEYVTTSVDSDSVKVFSYDKQFNYVDVISRYESNTSDDFFNEYNSVIDQTQDLKKQIDLAFKTNVIDSLRRAVQSQDIDSTKTETKLPHSTEVNYFRKILSNLQLDWNLSYCPIQSFDANFDLNLNNTFYNNLHLTSVTKSNNLPIIFGVSWSYKLNRHWLITYQLGSSFKRFSNTSIKQNDIGLAYRLILNAARKPIIVESSIKYANVQYGVDFGGIDNPMKNIIIDKQKFNSKSILTGIYQQTEGIKLGVAGSIYSKKSKQLILSIDYMYPLNSSIPSFQIKEIGFFELFPSKVKISLDDSRLTMSHQSNLQLPKISSNFWFGLTYRVRL
ncbi:hypothetical protein GCM10011514_51390 [Emticicia aquatilis]|uniref:Uncharacterized protein n=2 Tax=Emticicia aquatilis TaxID=1537369 RepID=A0A917DYI9_9BACT|nr:hypothetical protein GCM10011514_51390 [Emticicia aquatilis]